MSGSGKSSLVNARQQIKPGDDYAFRHFDSLGVTSEADMIRAFGPGRGWQEHMTRHWAKEIATTHGAKGRVVLEGQMDMEFMFGAIATLNFH